MPSEFNNRMKSRISAEIARLNRRIAATVAEHRPQEQETTGDNTPLSDDADAMQAIEEDWATGDHLDRLIQRSRALCAALDRIIDGTFGNCHGCGERIDRVRLLAVPEATCCVDCQQGSEAARAGGKTAARTAA